MTRPDLDALEALLAKATPGPYYWFMRECANKDELIVELAAVVDKTVAVNGYNLHGVGVGEPEPDADYLAVAHTGCGPRSPINAQLIVAAVNALPELIARVRELERERQNYRAMRDNGGSTHWDIAEVGAICHSECAITQLRDARRAAALAMRERCAQACEELASVEGIAQRCAAAIRALEP